MARTGRLILLLASISTTSLGAAVLSRTDLSARLTGGAHELMDCLRCLPRSVKALASSPLESLLLSCTMPTDRLPPQPQLDALTDGLVAVGRAQDALPEAYEVVLRKTLSKVHREGTATHSKARMLSHMRPRGLEVRCQGAAHSASRASSVLVVPDEPVRQRLLRALPWSYEAPPL